MHNLKIKGGFLLKLRKNKSNINILYKTHIDNIINLSYSIKDYELDQDTKELLSKIASIETNSLSVKEAYDFIDIIKNSANLIIGKDNSNAK